MSLADVLSGFAASADPDPDSEPEPEWKPQPRARAPAVAVLRCSRCRTAMSVIRVSDLCGRCQLDDLRDSGYLPGLRKRA